MKLEILAFLADRSNQPLVNAVVFIMGGVIGFLVSRFTMTKAEKKNYEQTTYENGISHSREIELKYKAFCDALQTYATKKGDPTLNDFHAVSTSGDMYFGELKIVGDAILQGKIDRGSRDRTFVPKIVEALQKNIPQYYETLVEIAHKINAPYDGKFQRHNYQSMIDVAEKFSSISFPANSLSSS